MIRNFFPRTGWIILALLFLLYSNHSDAQTSPAFVQAELAKRDSLLFNAALKTCQLDVVEKILAADFEFQHDPGGGLQGLTLLRDHFLENLKNNFCKEGSPKVRRELVNGSVQVSLLDQYGAVQSGLQRFYVVAEQGVEQLLETSRFTRVWKKQKGDWQLSKESDFVVKESKIAAAGGNYIPDNPQLYNTIVKMDSLLFDAYDNCKLEVSEAMYSDSIEFYHDKGGLMTSKKQLIQALRDNICGKVTRRLVPGSIEVYPIGNWGAIELGLHGFDNKLEPNAPKSNARFIIIWQNKNGKWMVSRVVSLH